MTDDLTAPPDISLLTPTRAGELLQRMSGNAQGRPMPTNVSDMTKAEAGRALDAMAKAPLQQVDPVADAIAGFTRPDEMHASPLGSTTLPPLKLADFAGALRESGFNDTGVEFILRDKPVTAADVEMAKLRKAELMADPVWVAAYLNGNVKARHDMAAWNYILSAEVAP
jgi:hypothetical protein